MNPPRELVFGTTNPAKVAQVQGVLSPLGIRVRDIGEFDVRVEVVEDGETAQENARKKAIAFAQALGRPILSIDNALYLDGLDDNEQPGVYVRRIAGSDHRPTDEELIAHYSRLVNRLGGNVSGRWEYAIALARPNGPIHETTILSPRQFVGAVSPIVVPGYPLESIQIDPDSGQYISEMSEGEQARFWEKTIGAPLGKFVSDSI